MKTAKLWNKKCSGFTLIEMLFATVLIGLVIAALAASSGAFTMYNAAGLDLSTSEFLIEEIRELTAPVAFANLGVYHNQSYNPPRDAENNQMGEFGAYTQNVTVQYVTPANLSVVAGGATDFRRVTVAVSKGGQNITSTSWIRASY